MEYSKPLNLEEYDKRFFGIYRGVIVNNNDPLGLNRVKVQVPQVTGTAVTNWIPAGSGSHPIGKAPYGSWLSSTTQTATLASTNYVIGLDTVEGSYGIDFDNTNNYLIFNNSGTYNIQFSAQVFQPTNNTPDIDIWVQVNNVDVNNSTGRVTTSNQIHFVLPAWNYVLALNAGDKLRFYWATSIAGTQLIYVPKQSPPPPGTPLRPAIPSMSVTASLVDSWIPNPGSGAWVMYEGGDPNYPVWMGGF